MDPGSPALLEDSLPIERSGKPVFMEGEPCLFKDIQILIQEPGNLLSMGQKGLCIIDVILPTFRWKREASVAQVDSIETNEPFKVRALSQQNEEAEENGGGSRVGELRAWPKFAGPWLAVRQGGLNKASRSSGWYPTASQQETRLQAFHSKKLDSANSPREPAGRSFQGPDHNPGWLTPWSRPKTCSRDQRPRLHLQNGD